jgi:tetratricopeptide (TPR) repeat protein
MDCLVIARELGDQKHVAWTTSDLALIALNLGDWAEAKAYTEESFSLFRELGGKYGLSLCYSYFGFLALLEGDKEKAQSFFEPALELARTSGPLWLGANALMGLAGVAASKQARRAARLLGAAEARLKAGASYWDSFQQLCIRRATAAVVAQLDETAFAAAHAEGWAMTFEQAATYALESQSRT